MDEDKLILRAREEREKIFQRYDKGRSPGADIDEFWEDPGLELYHQLDRYGFIHDQRLPDRPKDQEKRAKTVEQERVKKWLKMSDKWNSKDTKEKLNKRIYKGIPDMLRTKVWMKLLNLEAIMADKRNQNKYKEMLKLARTWGTEVRQIDSDVNRQFREHIIFRERYNIKQQSLFNVLVAYSMYNTEVGYCQGMSTLAGMLLMYMNEEEAFWALHVLLADPKYAMHGLYIEGFPKLTRFLAHHDKILTKFIPKIKKHFDQCNLDAILYSLKWFFVIFVERIPFSLCLRVWDIYLLDGERVVTAMAYTVLRLHKKNLLKLRDMDAIVQFLQVKLHKDFGFDDDHVIKTLEQSMEELKKAKLDLPPAPESNELPKKPFGVFVEPTKAEKIGHRKTDFSQIEKEVTETVISKRELTASEIADEAALAQLSSVAMGYGGSSSQLNTVQIPESEDGGSLLGSSKRSLADTSVTSTADLSVFSGGPRSSQQHYDLHFDHSLNENCNLNGSDIDLQIVENEIEEDENGESSPNSAFGSSSVMMAKSSSTIQVFQEPAAKQTPLTPTMSPQDVVRIYVPGPPPVELPDRLSKRRSGEEKSFNNEEYQESIYSGRSSIIHLEYDNNSVLGDKQSPIRPGQEKLFSHYDTNDGEYSSYNHGPPSDAPSYNTHKPAQQFFYYPQPNHSQTQYVSSSSRRGSMSRKTPSPMLESEMIIECDHMRHKRSMENVSFSNGIKPAPRTYQFNQYNQFNETNENQNPRIKRLTSFEELAKNSSTNSLLFVSQSGPKYEEDSDLEVPPSPMKREHFVSKPKSDYSIHYRNFQDEQEDYQVHTNMRKSSSHSHSVRPHSRKHSQSDQNAFEYDLLKEKHDKNGSGIKTDGGSIKSYNRFFNNDDEDEDEEELDEKYRSLNSQTRKNGKYTRSISGTEADVDEEIDTGKMLPDELLLHSDDENSSNSPPKSADTPINETMPLISMTVAQDPVQAQIVASNRNAQKTSKIPRYNKRGSFSKNSSISSPEEADKSQDSFDNRLAQSFGGTVSYQSPIVAVRRKPENKIRIKINQKTN